jgi:hypothetical protein
MSKSIFLVIIIVMQASAVLAQLHLSPVNTGDCVAARITTKRTAFLDEYDRKYCAQNKDKKKEKECLENSRSQQDFSFFTDRCSETEYYIGINGKEVQLKRISGNPARQPYFIGSFAAKGIHVVINNPQLKKKTYFEGEERNEFNVEDAVYKVDVIVKQGTTIQKYKDVDLWYGR